MKYLPSSKKNFTLVKAVYHSLHLDIKKKVKSNKNEGAFLILRMLSRSIVSGKIYLPSIRNKKNLIFVGTQNQLNSLSNIRQKLLQESTTYYHGNDVSIMDRYKNKFPFWMSYFCAFLFYFFFKKLQTSVENKLSYHNNNINYRYRISLILGYYYVALILTRLTKPKRLWLSNDHTYVNVAFLYASKKLNVKSVYLQHASVSHVFPPLNFDTAFLDGKISLSIYSKIGICGTKCFLTGISKMDGYINIVKQTGISKKVMLCLNQLDDEHQYEVLIDKLIICGFQVKIRKHPYFKNILKNEGGVEVSREKVFMDSLNDVDLLIAGDSNVHLEATLTNVPCFYLSTSKYFDYYGFLKNDLVVWGGRDMEECLKQVQNYKFDEAVYLRAKPYCASVGTEYENQSTTFILNKLGINGDNDN